MASVNFDFNSSIGQSGDHYEYLGIARNASEEDIRRAYKKLARKVHPDKNSGVSLSEEKMKHLNKVRDILSDPKKRIEYDEQLANDDLNTPIARDLM